MLGMCMCHVYVCGVCSVYVVCVSVCLVCVLCVKCEHVGYICMCGVWYCMWYIRDVWCVCGMCVHLCALGWDYVYVVCVCVLALCGFVWSVHAHIPAGVDTSVGHLPPLRQPVAHLRPRRTIPWSLSFISRTTGMCHQGLLLLCVGAGDQASCCTAIT